MRYWRVVLAVLLLVLGGGLVAGHSAPVGAVGVWTEAAPLGPPISGDDLSLLTLPDGRVLLSRIRPTEPERLDSSRYDPATNTWNPTRGGLLQLGAGAPVLLADGRALFSAGRMSGPTTWLLATAQLYDAVADTWTPVGNLTTARMSHTATLLNDGTVLVVGGQTGQRYTNYQPLGSAERFDPRTGQWTAAGTLRNPRTAHTATLLADGRVLVAGGWSTPDNYRQVPVLSAEIYDPATNSWTTAAEPLRTHGGGATAVQLPSGQVLLIGGGGNGQGPPTALAERYDPAQNRWTLSAPKPEWGNSNLGLLLADGRVLAFGGPATFLYDPVSDTWVYDAPQPFSVAAVSLLRDGRVFASNVESNAIYSRLSPTLQVFPETGYAVRGKFLDYWRTHGGLAIHGYPLSEERSEVLEDGKTYTVQYFERSRFEYHPQNQPPYDVLLGQFGRRIFSRAYGEYAQYEGFAYASRRVDPLPGARYFGETGHNLGGAFLAYWEANGGLAQFGYPITEERWDSLPVQTGGACCRTQYFERARFEYHPENAAPYDVLLGQFGRQIMLDNALLGPTFGNLYLSNARVRDHLGAPRAPEATTAGASQLFETGLMFWADGRGIVVLIGSPDEGRIAMATNNLVFWQDTWTAGQDPGGGPAPAPNRYLPQRGFGKLWREQQLRNSVGYATTPNEQGFTLTMQEFAAGYLLSVETPAGRSTYALYLQASGSHYTSRIGSYERIAR